jgi:putative PEP-CTERM system histidine kinase
LREFGEISFGLAGGSFLLLALLLAVGWEGRRAGIRLIVACALTSLWALVYAVGAKIGGLPVSLMLVLEVLRSGAWILVLTGLARAMGFRPTLLHLLHGLLATLLLVALLLPWLPGWAQSATAQRDLLIHVGIGLALAGLVLLEQVYRNSRAEMRDSMKLLAVALGVIFAYDLYVYAQAQLLHGMEQASWEARGIVTVLTVPMLAIAARRNPEWSLNIFVSRQVVFYTASLMGIGVYLVLMAVGGYLVALYGGTWGRVAQLVFVVGAAMTLAALLASSDIRRRLKVFIAKHFYRNKYDYRIEWLRFIQTLSAPAGRSDGSGESVDPYVRAIRAIAQIVGSPGGLLFLRDDGTGAFTARTTWPGTAAPLAQLPVLAADAPMIRFLESRQWVIDVEEHRLTPDVYDNLELPALFDPPSPHRLVLPLLDDANLVGVLVLAEPPPPFRPTYEDRDLLKTVGRHVATHIAQHEADRRLAESRQFEAYHRLTAFVMHDLKNLAAQLSLIVSNAERHKRNPEFVDDAISTVANSTERMQRLIEQLQGREQRSQLRTVGLGDVVRRAIDRCTPRTPVPRLVSELNPQVAADPERLTAAIEHLLRNAQDATPETGSITVSLATDGAYAVLAITDTGSGMSPEFVTQRLFKPFDTTKGSKGMGIGAYQAREYITMLGGALGVRSAPGAGSTFELRLKSAAP